MIFRAMTGDDPFHDIFSFDAKRNIAKFLRSAPKTPGQGCPQGQPISGRARDNMGAMREIVAGGGGFGEILQKTLKFPYICFF